MATLKICDLCNGAIKESPIAVKFDGFPHKQEGEDALESETNPIEEVHRLVFGRSFFSSLHGSNKRSVDYEICNTCAERMLLVFEHIRHQYHAEAKEMPDLSIKPQDALKWFQGIKNKKAVKSA